MKKTFLFICLLVFGALSFAQNLVPNPGFEEFDVCPPNTSINTLGVPRINDYIKFWEDTFQGTATDLGASSDFFHLCANIYNSNIAPASGNGHVGGFAYTNDGYREYVQTQLKSPLCKGRTYRIKLKLASGSKRFVDRIGVLFTVNKLSPPDWTNVNIPAQVTTPPGQFINNRNSWREFTMNFTNTDGGELYMAIGNFFNNANTNRSGSGLKPPYIYIDDVSVEDITPAITVAGGAITNANCGATDGNITGLSVSGGSGIYTYKWIDNDNNTVSTDLNPSNLAAGSYELLIDDGSCQEVTGKTFTIGENCPSPCPKENLVPNPGFEEIKKCPNQRSLTRNDLGKNVKDWYSPNDGKPTLFHRCNPIAPFMTGTPSPYPGKGYVGVYTYYFGEDRKDYIQTKLKSPMIAGESYIVKFDVQLRWDKNYATDQMGVYFSNNAVINNATDGELGVTPSLKTPAGTYFTNSDSWQTVNFLSPYVATGGEEYITIGKFENLSNTTFQDLVPGQGNAQAYYFIDNVVVEPMSGGVGTVDAGADVVIDLGASTILNATVSNGSPSYVWSPATGLNDTNIANPTAAPTTTTTYTVTADFGGGCVDIDAVTITVNDPSCTYTIDAGIDQTINVNETALLQATPVSGTPINYAWTPTTNLSDSDIADPVFTPPAGSGTYAFTVTADFGGGCTDTDQVTITVNPSSCTLVVAEDPSSNQQATCGNGDGQARITISGATNYTVTWQDENGSTVTVNEEENPTNLPEGSYTVTVSDSDIANCNQAIIVAITEDCPQCMVSIDQIDPKAATCYQSVDGGAQATISGTSNPMYSWRDSENTEISTANSLNNQPAGQYFLIVNDGNLPACGDTLSFNISEPAALELSMSSMDADCGQTNGSITGIAISGNTGSETYSWSNEAGMEVGTSLSLSGVGRGSYTLTVTNGICKTTSGPHEVNEQGAPVLDATNLSISDADCGQTNGSITGFTITNNTGSETYSWKNASGTEVGTTLDLNPIGQGIYTLTVVDAGCTATSGPYSLNETCPNCDLSMTVNSTDADCGLNNGSATAQAMGGTSPYTYAWELNGIAIGGNSTLSNIGGGRYQLTVTDATGCIVTEEVEVIPLGGDVPTVDLGEDQTLCTEDQLTLDASFTEATYLWQDGSTSATYEVTTEGLYRVEVSNDCGTTSDDVYISVEICTDPPAFEVKIANTLTPNGDGDNDTFFIENIWEYPNNRLQIFNRWGDKIYQADGYSNEWEGTYQGKAIPMGTYYYILQLNGTQKQVFKGSISVVR